jgi:hypothetical protein
MRPWRAFFAMMILLLGGACLWLQSRHNVLGFPAPGKVSLADAGEEMTNKSSENSILTSADSAVEGPLASPVLTGKANPVSTGMNPPNMFHEDIVTQKDFCGRNFMESEWREQSDRLLEQLKLEPVVENIHLQLAKGEERRIQKLLNENNQWEYRLFSVDQEGLPELWENTTAGWSNKQEAQRWLAEGSRVTRDQKTLVGESENGDVSVRLQTEFGILAQLEYVSPSFSMNCQSLGCFCR